jgi:hypothetical protein
MTATVAGIHLGIDTHANRPAANTAPDGSLYSCSTHSLVYKSNFAGNSWATWATLGTVGGGNLAGTELDYAQITSTVNVTATSEATADTVVTGASVAYDGSTVVEIEFFAPWATADSTAGRDLRYWLYDGSSSIGFLGLQQAPASGVAAWVPVVLKRRLTPSNASHTYGIRASVSAGTGVVTAGAGGSGTAVPAFIRITRVSS